MARLAGGVIGKVRIGAIQALDPFDLSGALAAFHTEHPGVELGEHVPDVAQEHLPGLGQLHPAGRSREQGNPQLRLQLSDLHRYRGLGDM